MDIPIAIIDAFANKPFTGNPAAVCLLERQMPDEWMQSVAAEMNLSETAFLLREGKGKGEGVAEGEGWRLRWMTPTVEVDLCGHATLASARYLLSEGLAEPGKPIHFNSRSGVLIATPGSEQITLDFPAIPSSPIEYPPLLRDGLGAEPVQVGRGRFDYLVELHSASVVRELAPDFAKLKQLDARGIVVTARADDGSEHDYVCRGFFPASGIDEDPVTGSAHCMLAPFWADRLGKKKLIGYQASKRGGYVGVEVADDKVHLTGNAVIVLKGMLKT